MMEQEEINSWTGHDVVDHEGAKIGKLEEVYYDTATDKPMFGTIKEGHLRGRHLTFVPLDGLTIGPDNLQLSISVDLVEGAPNIDLEGGELSSTDEKTLYHHYGLNYTAPDTESGRRLSRH